MNILVIFYLFYNWFIDIKCHFSSKIYKMTEREIACTGHRIAIPTAVQRIGVLVMAHRGMESYHGCQKIQKILTLIMLPQI